MYRITHSLIILFLFFLFSPVLASQDTSFFILQEVEIKGNKRTKDRIILRELDMMPGDTIPVDQLGERLYENKKRILNTGLFTLVTLNIKRWDMMTGYADLDIEVTENLYIYPLPIFELADRNFNVWWNEQGRSLARVNYGARITHINFTGNRDVLRLVTHFGYTRKFELRYQNPYINSSQTIGLFGNIFYADRKEIGYKTINNKTLFASWDDRVLLKRFRINGGVEYRPDLNQFHRFNISFHHNKIDAFVADKLNPYYFPDGKTDHRFFLLEYRYRLDNRIFFFYPEGKNLFSFSIKKEGLGIFNEINNLSISAEYEQYFKFSDLWILGMRIKGKTNLIRSKQAFANNTGLGYGFNFLRGYELYVLDGTDYIYTKNALKFKVFEKLWTFNRIMPLNAFKKMFVQVFLSTHLDVGYVYEGTYKETNDFNNRVIYGYGPGVDVVLYNNFLFKVEYSFNHLGEGGLYLSNLFNF